MLLLCALANAQVVTNVKTPVKTDHTGTFFRVFPKNDARWWFVIGGGGLTVTEKDNDFVTVAQGFSASGRDDISDHGVAQCPDGTWLHVASINVTDPNDSAFAFRYSGNFQTKLASAWVEKESTVREHHDAPVVCGDTFQGVSFRKEGVTPMNTWFALDGDVEITDQINYTGKPQAPGSSLLELDAGTLMHAGFQDYMNGPVYFRELDTSMGVVSSKSVNLPPSGEAQWWSQGFIQVGDVYLMVNMSRAANTFTADEGNVWLHVFDGSFNLLESYQVSQHTGDRGGMRPFITRRGSLAMVTWDSELRGHYAIVKLDLEEAGLTGGEDTGEPQDTGEPVDTSVPEDTSPPVDTSPLDTDPPEDTGDSDATPEPEPKPEEEGCGGCGGGLTVGWLGLLVLPLVRRRR